MTEIDRVKKSLISIHNFSDEQLDAFISKLTSRKIARKGHLLRPSQKCNFMAFITKGSFRFYSQTDTEEPTLHFFTENNWVADYESLVSQEATKNYLQALEDTEIQVISLDNIHLLMEEYPVFRNLMSLMNKWVISSSHHISVSNTSPDDRYRKLLEEHPDWVNRFPQMYIASYLGMTKETFSRVKARMK
jgi:CRP-like cAMP-binding protein